MYHKILVPLDGSPLAEKALPAAINLAKTNGANVILMSVIAEPMTYYLTESLAVGAIEDPSEKAVEKRQAEEAQARNYLDPLADKLRGEGLVVSNVVLCGPPAATIVDYARDEGIDVIVMSTHGRSGVQRWLLGSVADRILHAATVPVLLIRANA